MAEKKFPQAIKAYEAVPGIAGHSPFLVRLHSAYVAAGMPQEAEVRLAQWLREKPDDAVIRLHAAETAIGRADYKGAILHYEWLQKKQADNVVVLNNLAWAYFQMKDARALETAERAHKLAPEDPSVADTLGMQLIEGGNHQRGIALLEKAAKAAPDVSEIRYHLAQGWIKAGDKTKARAELERALSMNEKFTGHAEAQKLLKQLRE
jgi:tetratricopeptide (TPR) repeat protein